MTKMTTPGTTVEAKYKVTKSEVIKAEDGKIRITCAP